MSITKTTSLLVVSQYFFPEQFRINDICTEWVKRGYDVTVITGIPNYPRGKFYDGYGLFKKRIEIHEGVSVIRLPIVSRGSSKLKLGLNYLSFVVSGFLWSLFTKRRADLVFSFEVSPMTQVLPAVWFAKRRHIPCIAYIQDLWPENFEAATGIHNPCIIKVISRMSDYIYVNCEMILVTSDSFKRTILNRGIPEDKVLFWPQYSEDFYRPQKNPSPLVPSINGFTVIFTGNIGHSQGLEILPRAAKILKKRGLDIRFVIVGEGRGTEFLKKIIHDNGVIEEFFFIPQQPPQLIPGILAAADVAFVSFSSDPLYKKTIPAKLQSYMACGLPIIAAACGETREIIISADAGLCVDPGDFQALSEVIQTLAKDHTEKLTAFSSSARRYANQHFDKKKLMDELCGYIDKLMFKGKINE